MISAWSHASERGDLRTMDRDGGVGAAVRARIVELARARSCTAVSLEVLDANPRVASLYERHGFRADRRAFVLRLASASTVAAM